MFLLWLVRITVLGGVSTLLNGFVTPPIRTVGIYQLESVVESENTILYQVNEFPRVVFSDLQEVYYDGYFDVIVIKDWTIERFVSNV